MTLPAPADRPVPTLLVRARALRCVDTSASERRYREALGDLLHGGRGPNGHNLLWESPAETIAAIERFLGLDPRPAARVEGRQRRGPVSHPCE